MIKKFLKDESGQGMVEYILIIALVAAVLVGLFKLFGNQLYKLFDDATKKIGAANPDH
jgi:pilus assembly protein Flp/PilA